LEGLGKLPIDQTLFLSGGIGLDETDFIKTFLQQTDSQYFKSMDVNSRFEIEPGLKDVGGIKNF